jgi:error-prone DNA polymerase
MPSDGIEVVAHWREAGAWWQQEPELEVIHSIGEDGIRRETIHEHPTLGVLKASGQSPLNQDNTEEWAYRIRKIRDEKVSAACGTLPTLYYQDRLRERAHQSGIAARFQDHLPAVQISQPALPYVPLHVCSGYAFGCGTMLAEEIPRFAALWGMPGIAICDPFSLVGCVEFARAARKHQVKPLIGAEIELEVGGKIVLIAKSKIGYQQLSQLITHAHLLQPRGYPLATWELLEKFSRDLLCLTAGHHGRLNQLLAGRQYDAAESFLTKLIQYYGATNVLLECERSFAPWERRVEQNLIHQSEKYDLPCVAGGRITHSRKEHYPVHDVLVCSETLAVVDDVLGRKAPRHATQLMTKRTPERWLNAERYLRTSHEQASLFADRPEWLHNTLRVLHKCDDDVLPSRTQLNPLFTDDHEALRQIVYEGAHRRYSHLHRKLRDRIELEVKRIVDLRFSTHFLVAWDMCRWAEEQEIQYSGRGSVVDSVVSYCLGFSRIDAYKHDLHFDRFLPADGSKRPDIDIDFEAKRRDDIRNYLTHKYGPSKVATVSAIGAYCTRGIVREVGKVLGLPNQSISYLAKRLHGGVPPDQILDALEKRPELKGSAISKERFRWVFELAERMMDLPRNIRSHSSGVVISSSPLSETVPVMLSASEKGVYDATHQTSNVPIIQWDKRSAKYYFDKFDILCLRGQDVLSGTQMHVRRQISDFDITEVPTDDPNTYRTMRSGELIGIPQSASPAMRQAHIRLRTDNLEDASLVQAGIRPGVGGAVKINQLIARRRGLESYSFEHPEFERILGHTYGIIVFQEQVDQLLQAFCGHSSGEAEDIRDSIHKRRREDFGKMIRETLIEKSLQEGFSQSVAEKAVDMICGFKGYGFAQGHALAFAEVSVRSIYCQQNYPAEYFAALLSAQPAGYYGPCTLVNEARSRGITILPPDVEWSQEHFSVEDVKSKVDPQILVPNSGIRVGLMQIHGLSSNTKERILHNNMSSSKYTSFFDFVAKVQPDRDELETLILCGCFDRFCSNRRALLWSIPRAIQYCVQTEDQQYRLPLSFHVPEIPKDIEDFSDAQKSIYERQLLELDVHRHLMSMERERVSSRGGISAREVSRLPHGRKAIVVGNPIRLRFPPTPSGKRVVFFDLEDETGLLNVTCFDAVYQADGHAIICSPYVTVIGESQDRDGHIGFMAKRVFPYRPVLSTLLESQQPLPIATADFLVG